jgi:hypothetical protein
LEKLSLPNWLLEIRDSALALRHHPEYTSAMKTLRSLVFAVVAVLAFGGCLQQEKIIKLKADGSGTIEERMVMGKQMVDQMKMMSGGLAGLGLGGAPAAAEPTTPAAPAFQVLDEKKLKAAAAKMGDGVTFVSATPLTTPAGEGYVATYAFTDISKVKISGDAGEMMPGGAAGMNMATKGAKAEPITFGFTKGAPATLTVNLPQQAPADLPKERPAMPAGSEDMMMTMMQQMFKDMKIALSIEVAGQIAQTNAEHRDGARVTLMEMDFNKVLANPEKFKALTKAQPKSIDEMKALVKGVEGIKAEGQPQVTVKFQ